jgi:hypothetical protein
MPRKKRLDRFHWHEALDRSLLASEFFDDNVLQHPAIEANQDLRREAAEISKRLFRLYQSVGTEAVRRKRRRL